MHNIKRCRVNPISFLVVSLFSATTVFAEGETTNPNSDLTLNEDQPCLICQLSGSASLAYDSNLYDKDDYRSVRNLSWNGTLNYPVSEQLRAFITGGGYRVFQDKTGTYVTDTVVGLNYSNLFTFGETGRLGLGGQLTIPTSEASRDTELYTAFRLSVPVSFKMLGGNYSVSPRLRKNFYKYQTMNGRVLTEWVYSVSADGHYQFDKLTLDWGVMVRVIKGIVAENLTMRLQFIATIKFLIRGWHHLLYLAQVFIVMQSAEHWEI